MKKILLIDRDGTLVEEPFDYQIDSLDKIKLTPGVIPALLALQHAGFELIMISNQDGLGTERFPEEQFSLCHEFILDLFLSQGITFSRIFICPHIEVDNCGCRKPKTGLILDYLDNELINTNASWVIGDRETDRQLALNLQFNYAPISPAHSWAMATDLILNSKRQGVCCRTTKETSIELNVLLDAKHQSQINTPLPFFNHMLEQVALHGGFDLSIEASGDVEVDDHHLIEDVAIAFGDAFKQALGDKRGIERYGFTLPMDESLAQIAIDISGRSYCEFNAVFTREFVGGLATEMIPHFFQSLARSLEASIHLSVTGKNHHHMIEACFKALGRALKQASLQTGSMLPSTKGIL